MIEIVLAILAVFGVVGLVDVQFFQGRIGMTLSSTLPWTLK